MSIPTEVLAALAAALLGNFFLVFSSIRRSLRKPDPILYRTCVLGAPYSGKTTLVTRAFQEIFRAQVGNNVSLRGNSTIDIFTENSSRLEQGKSVLRTSASDVFVFRFDYERRSRPRELILVRHLAAALFNAFYRILYKVEIADYAGELSLNASLQTIDRVSENDLPSNDLIRWALDAQNYVFVIDCSPSSYFLKENISQTQFCQRIWLHLTDLKLDRSAKNERRNVCLYFNKIDTLLPGAMDTGDEKLPPVTVIDVDDMAIVSSAISTNYEDLISFFRSQSDRLKIVFGSSFARDSTGSFAGVNKFVEFTLPK